MPSKKSNVIRPPLKRAPKAAAAAAGAGTSTEDVARLAYALWESRGRPLGSPEEDWYRAEQELLNKR